MIDTDKWIESARISLDELEKEVKRLRLLFRELIKDMDADDYDRERDLREGKKEHLREIHNALRRCI